MIFSLIIGTLNRSKELQICLDSLLKQTYKGIEIIIIDQSQDDSTHQMVSDSKYDELEIVYQKVTFTGLSKARNEALKFAKGDYIALIDDDAAYDENYFLNAYKLCKHYPNKIFSGYIWCPHDNTYLADYDKVDDMEELSLRRIIRMAPSPGLIFPMCIVKQLGGFDEVFGVGSTFGACEETDLVLRLVDCGYKVVFSKKLIVKHPTITHTFEIENVNLLQKKENYACGLGALIAKDIYIRKKKRLVLIMLEKQLKIIIKGMGVLGKMKMKDARAEWIGLRRGFNEYLKMHKRIG